MLPRRMASFSAKILFSFEEKKEMRKASNAGVGEEEGWPHYFLFGGWGAGPSGAFLDPAQSSSFTSPLSLVRQS